MTDAPALRLTGVVVLVIGALVLALWLSLPRPLFRPVPPDIAMTPIDVADLPGWDDDELAGSLEAFNRSCAKFLKREKPPAIRIGKQRYAGLAWLPVCRQAKEIDASDPQEVRVFFETAFSAYRVRAGSQSDGLFTGYYEPIITGSLHRRSQSQAPLYKLPADLVTVKLGQFRDDLQGKTIVGRLKGNRLVPYYDRKAIDGGALAGQNLEIGFVDDAIDAFFLHIQGSGRIRLAEGGELRVGYAGQNGHRYHAIGRTLIEQGALTRETVSMQSIRQWLNSNADRAEAVLHSNPSYIFFRKQTGDGPLGAQGVALTPERSLAVDRHLFSYGLPFWVDMAAPDGAEGKHLRRLYIAQDTGGAIRGPIRGDVFWGAGDAAGAIAGGMKQTGSWYLLLPKAAVSTTPGA